MRRSSTDESTYRRSPSPPGKEPGFARGGPFFGLHANPGPKAAQARYTSPKGSKYVVFYLDLSFIFLLELKRCSMARGCLQGVKYLMFAFNLLFWVSGGGAPGSLLALEWGGGHPRRGLGGVPGVAGGQGWTGPWGVFPVPLGSAGPLPFGRPPRVLSPLCLPETGRVPHLPQVGVGPCAWPLPGVSSCPCAEPLVPSPPAPSLPLRGRRPCPFCTRLPCRPAFLAPGTALGEGVGETGPSLPKQGRERVYVGEPSGWTRSWAG